jgi:hypothetical protein
MTPDMDFWRQLDIVSPSAFENLHVTVIGAGGIGSPTTLALAKMGVQHIRVFDPDIVDLHNLPNQMYRFADFGQPKVEGLTSIVRDFSGVEIDAKNERYQAQPLSGIVISAVDSMAVRKQIWQRVRYNPSVSLYIEGRMGAEVARIYTGKAFDPDFVKYYEATLYSDEEASEAPCTARAVIYNVFMIASLVANQVKRFSKGESTPKELIFDFATFSFLVL